MTHASTPASDAKRLQWWQAARFGMFVHWGLYSVIAGEWQGRRTTGLSSWIQHDLQIPVADYEQTAQRFNPTRFDADALVALARAGGARYLVITTKHHEGFCLFPTRHTRYNVIDAAPCGRDLIGEVVAACRKADIRPCFYYSILDWHHPAARAGALDDYVAFMHNQLRELLTSYGDIGVLWFDGDWMEGWNTDLGRATYDFCRSLQPHIIMNNRLGKGRTGYELAQTTVGDFGTPEQLVPGTRELIPEYPWETCMTINDTWGYKSFDDNWKSVPALCALIDETFRKGGNFLLNIGPDAAGEIPPPCAARFRGVGDWLRTRHD